MALPTFFIIGAAKAGTTSLHYYLDQHPQIQMSAVKEPNFFSGPENGIPYPGGRVSSIRTYERFFDPAVGVRGEASVGYANHPRRTGVPERIKERVPDAKFIYLVRDPIARAISQYQHRVAVEGEHRPLPEALEDLSESSVYICPSLYGSQLDRYLQHFSQDRLLVIDQSELRANRRSTLRQVFAFLSVDETVDSSRFEEELNANHERRVYPVSYARLFGPVTPAPVRWIPRNLRRFLRRSVERILWPPVETPTPDAGLRARLEDRFAGEVERLRALTGKKFPTWSL